MDKGNVRERNTYLHTYIHTHSYTHRHTHTAEYYSAITKKEILPSAATWIDLQGIMPSEINQTGTSLVVQWLRIHLPIKGIQVQSLFQELRSHMPRGN